MNFSKSGIGYSFGMKGARIGTGPHGPYVAGGRGGIYYRQSLRNTLSLSPPPSPLTILATTAPCYCSHCGAAVLPGNEFCNQCGARVLANSIAALSPLGEETHDHHLGWLLIGGAFIFLALLRLLVVLNNTNPVPPSVSSGSPSTAIERPSVPFRIEEKTQGKPIIVWLASDTGDQQVRELVRYFKLEIQNRKFGDLGINSPTFIRQTGQKGDYSAGTVLFYRERSMKKRTSKTAGSKVAEYKWGIDGKFQKDSGRVWVDGNHTVKLY